MALISNRIIRSRAFCAALAVWGVDAAAAENERPPNSGEIRDVIYVTAQKRVQRIQDVPISISAFSGDTLERLGAENFIGVAPLTPGFQAHSPALQTSILTIRGIRSMDFVATAIVEPRISIYQDGVSISRAPGAVTELFDIERVEVLKGPQGALFGRSAEVGAIQIIQNKAANEIDAASSIAFGNLEMVEVKGFVNGPIIADKLYGRIAGLYKRRDGFLENTSGPDLYAIDRMALRGVLTFEPSDDLRFDLIANYQKDDAVAGSPENSVIPAVTGDRALGRVASMRVFGPNANQGDFVSPRELVDVSLLAEWQVSPEWTLASISAYRDYESRWFTDEDGSAFDFFQAAGFRDGKQWSQEVRAVYEGANRFSGFVGGSVLYEEPFESFVLSYDERQLLYFLNLVFDPASDPASDPILQSGDPSVLDPIVNSPPFNAANAFFQEQSFVSSEFLGIDIFAEIAIDVTSELNILLDGRWSYEEKTVRVSSGAVGPPSFIGGLGLGTSGVPVNTLTLPDTSFLEQSGNGQFDGFTWRAALRWAPHRSTSIWASYARGRRPELVRFEPGPIFSGFSVLPAETVDSYEVGVKAAIADGLIQIDSSAYYYSYENFVSGIFRDGTIVLETTGLATAYGVETQLLVAPAESLTFFASYAFNHSRFDAADKNGNVQDFAGNRFAFSPDHSFSIGAEWTSPPVHGWTLRATPVFSWQSAVFFDDENRPGFDEDAFGLLNANLEIGPEDARWKITASGENLLDRIYAIDGASLGTAFGTPTFYIGPPRLWRIGVSLDL